MIAANYTIFGKRNAVQVAFVSSWNTANTSAGSSTSTQVKLPLVSGGIYNFVVNWGDGNNDTITAWNAAATTHTYSLSGTYTITITGICTGWQFNNTGDRLKFLSVTTWGVLKLGDFTNNFQGCANLNLTTVSDNLNTTGKTYFAYLFTGCTSLTSVNNINSWDTNAVLYLDGMFQGCTNYSQNLSFNTSSVVSFLNMFYGCTNFNSLLSFNTSSATTMKGMFYGCSNFNQVLLFNTSSAISMESMLQGCSKFNQNIGGFNVSSVSNFVNMMNGCSLFNNGGSDSIKNWTLKTTGTVNCNAMFFTAVAFNQPILWNTVAVNNMSFMFGYCTAFNQNLGALNVSAVTDFNYFLVGKTTGTFSTTNLDAIYNGWSSRPVLANKTITFGSAKYTAAATAGRAILTGAPNNWVITDGGI